MSYYLESDHLESVTLKIKRKVVLHLSNYATKEDLDHPTDINTSDGADRKIIALKAVVDKLDIKGYLRYKTITSQNVPSKAQIKNLFIW